MAINVNTANNQADQLSTNVWQLRQAKQKLSSYRSSINTHWQGKEATDILTAIDQVIGQINRAIQDIEGLSRDIKAVAAQIKREEEAAAARARAAKQQRIRVAQAAYDTACEELSDLESEREQLVRLMSKKSLRERMKLMAELEKLDDRINSARNKCSETYSALRAAKR